jgi:hypothetical protein
MQVWRRDGNYLDDNETSGFDDPNRTMQNGGFLKHPDSGRSSFCVLCANGWESSAHKSPQFESESTKFCNLGRNCYTSLTLSHARISMRLIEILRLLTPGRTGRLATENFSVSTSVGAHIFRTPATCASSSVLSTSKGPQVEVCSRLVPTGYHVVSA